MFFQATAAVMISLAPVQAEQLVGRWEGVIALPDDQFMPAVLRVMRGPDGKIIALADNQMIGDVDRPVADLTLVDGVVSFQVTGVGRYESRLSGDTIEGTFSDTETSMPLVLTRKPA